MKNIYPAILLMIMVLLSGCTGCITVRQLYYLSPTNTHANPYHTIPLKSDSLKTATYISAAYNAGMANYQGHDNVFSFRVGIHRSHNFGSFQAYYGALLALGTYKIANNYFGYYTPVYDSMYRIYDIRDFFGSYGLNGGINLVLPFRRWEWRVLGLETSLQNEFGDYLSFRKNLPDSAANIIFRKNSTTTLGLYTDFSGIRKRGTTFGFKIAYGVTLNSIKNYSNQYKEDIFPLFYFSPAVHVTKGHVTGYFQLNFGVFAYNGQLGLNYRVGK